MMTTISNHRYWNNNSSDQSSNYDALFSSTFCCIDDDGYDQDSMSSMDQYEEALLSSPEVNIFKFYFN